MYIVLLNNKVQGFPYYKCLSSLNVSFEFKFYFIIQIQVLNSYYILRFSYSISFLPPQAIDQKRSCRILSHFESSPFPPRRETRSPLGFSDKNVKKSRNFGCYAQKPSILPRNRPTCWDITKLPKILALVHVDRAPLLYLHGHRVVFKPPSSP
jgi:hypothetical protein